MVIVKAFYNRYLQLTVIHKSVIINYTKPKKEVGMMRGVISLRIESSLLDELDKAVKEEGKSRTGLIKEAIRYYLQHLRRGKNQEGFVPFVEYRKVNEELKNAMDRIAKLEAENAELKKENEMLKSGQKKRRWFFG